MTVNARAKLAANSRTTRDTTGRRERHAPPRRGLDLKRGHSHVVKALGDMLGIAAIGSTTKDGQIPRHADSDSELFLFTAFTF
jgi:hypothetical protein